MDTGNGLLAGTPAWWAQRIRRRQDQSGFTLIELLVVIIILGILAAVVVFAVGGVGDKGEASAREIDRRTLATAQEAYFANNGRYATEAELVGGGLLSEESSTHKVYLNNAAGSCPAGNRCEFSIGLQDEVSTITLYNGRSGAFSDDIITAFTADTGITVTQVTTGGSSGLATQILTEGASTPADVFYSQDAGNLQRVSQASLFKKSPAAATGKVLDPNFQAVDGTWTGVSGRVRVIAHKPSITSAASVPTNVDALVAGGSLSPWAGNRVGYDPANASFQNFIAAMIAVRGNTTRIDPLLPSAQEWLNSLTAIDPDQIMGNRNIAAAVANNTSPTGTLLGLINHYYRFQGASGTPTFANADVANSFPISTTANKDVGSLVNAAGVGILKNTANPGAAELFVRYLLSDSSQEFFSNATTSSGAQNREYPLTAGAQPHPDNKPLSEIASPNTVLGLDLNTLDNAAAVALLTSTGHLPQNYAL